MVEKTLQACSAAPENRNIPSDSISLCEASAQDAPFLAKVYNQAILAGDCTCDTEPVTVEERETWIRQRAAEGYPVYLCLEDGKPVGYGYLTAYRPGRRAVAHVAEISYYLDFSAHRRHIGSRLMAALEQRAQARGVEVLIAILVGSNRPSIGLLKKFGYTEWGRLPQIVHFSSHHTDHLIYGKYL